MPTPTKPVTRRSDKLCRAYSWFAASLLTMQYATAEEMAALPQFSEAFTPATMALCTTDDDGFLSGRLFGALSEQIEWRGADMECGGMLRPENKGIRLVFPATRQGKRLLVVLGIDGTLDELVDAEHATNITIIDEARKHFFSTGNQARCWSTVTSVQPVPDSTDRILQVAGEVYCAGSITSLSDNSSVSLRDMHYSGRLLLDGPEQD